LVKGNGFIMASELLPGIIASSKAVIAMKGPKPNQGNWCVCVCIAGM
jgi:hypothetical protein